MTHSLFLAIHEISHFLAFEKPIYNRYLALVANIPIGIPYCAAFRGYHMEHHTSQGYDQVDTDIPTKLEAQLLASTLGKLFYCIFQIMFYALRPMFVRAQVFTFWHFINWTFQISVMSLMIYAWGPNPFYYFLVCDFLSGSLHPMVSTLLKQAGHFIAEHFVFVKGYETYSYYGPLNL
jgi:sphingolipid 4-desaturase/C4-monooxygenase